jgi:hypothetical protein
VYFLEKKSEAFKTFKKFKVMVEKMMGKNIRSLRSNRDSEYLSVHDSIKKKFMISRDVKLNKNSLRLEEPARRVIN